MMNPALNESIVGKVGAVAGGRGELAELNRRKHQDPQVLELQAQVAEKKRREQGQESSKTKEQLAKAQRRREIDRIKREKAAEKKERERLRAEIAKDKAERRARGGRLADPR